MYPSRHVQRLCVEGRRRRQTCPSSASAAVLISSCGLHRKAVGRLYRRVRQPLPRRKACVSSDTVVNAVEAEIHQPGHDDLRALTKQETSPDRCCASGEYLTKISPTTPTFGPHPALACGIAPKSAIICAVIFPDVAGGGSARRAPNSSARRAVQRSASAAASPAMLSRRART